MDTDLLEMKDRLASIEEMVGRLLDEKKDMLLSTQEVLLKIRAIAKGNSLEVSVPSTNEPDHIIISCDASIKQNPGGPSSVGFVIQVPGKKDLSIARPVPAKTNNQAEYDAVYLSLVTLFDLNNRPSAEVEVRSDSQLVIRQLNGEIECKDPTLLKKRDLIRELVAQVPVTVKFVWRPRNSTPQLELANFLCQDLLGVPRH